ncbi:hypothetical protein CLERM_453 [Coxiella-like endosymbiont]|nr:hypothetical protein CLERM_453 [Coxiella-like endosymbiont]
MLKVYNPYLVYNFYLEVFTFIPTTNWLAWRLTIKEIVHSRNCIILSWYFFHYCA